MLSFEAMSGPAAYGKLKFGPFELSIGERLLRREGVVLALGGRALDILIYLARRPGEVIAKRELIDHVWPDVTVEEGSIRVHVAAIRKALGDGQFGTRYIANIRGRGYSFVGTVVPLAGSTESRNAKFRHQGRLPVRPIMMIGRDTVVSQVSDKLRNERFVTLLGPGGIGKTTVALAVGRAAAEEFGGKVHFVDLESLTDPRHVAGAVATSLGLPLKSKDPGLELVDLVRSRKLLIILDSCEHVIETVALLAEQLYQETEQVYLLTTSRELLKVEGEHCYRVLPLEFPSDGSEQTANAVLRYPAVQLFVRRVAARAGSFVLTDEEAPFVAEMCRKLDGLPLAIELAAGQVAALGVKNTVARLELLKFGRRSAVARHQTLKATFDWSYDRLSDVERTAFIRVAPFVGHFTLDGARYVADDLGFADGDFFDAIARLVEKSLIATRLNDGQVEYRLLNTTRAYALKRLEAHAELDAVLRRHAEYFTGRLESQREALLPLPQAERVAAHSRQLSDVRAALEWSFGPRGDAEIATRLAVPAAQLLLELSLLTECQLWSERAMALLGSQHPDSRREMESCATLPFALMYTEGNNQRVRTAFSRARSHAAFCPTPTIEQELAGPLVGDFQIVIDRLARLFAQFKPYWPSCLLSDRRAVCRVSARSDILDLYRYDVTATKLAVDRQIEHGKVASATFDLEFRPDYQTCLGRSGGFAPVTLPLIPRYPSRCRVCLILHGHTPRLRRARSICLRALESRQLSGHCGLCIRPSGQRSVAIDPSRISATSKVPSI